MKHGGSGTEPPLYFVKDRQIAEKSNPFIIPGMPGTNLLLDPLPEGQETAPQLLDELINHAWQSRTQQNFYFVAFVGSQ